MADSIVIRLNPDPDAPVDWILSDTSGARHGHPMQGPLQAAADAAAGHRVLVLLPAADCLITTADVPAKGSRLLQALPFALEEQVAEDVEKLHFAAGARRSNGLTPVVVINRTIFEQYLERISDCGLKPTGVYAETQGLARIPGTISMLIDDGNVIVNDGADAELALQQISPGDALVAIGALDDPTIETGDDDEDIVTPPATLMPKHVLVYLSIDDNERYNTEFAALRNELESIETRILADGSLPRLAAAVSAGKAINLLQGAFAQKSGLGATWQPWRNVALLLLAVGAVALISSVTQYFALKREDRRLQIAVEQQFRQTFPWISNVTNPRGQMQSELNRVGASDADAAAVDFLEALMALSSAVREAPGSKIDGISYRAGVADVQLFAPNIGSVEKIEKSVRDSADFDARIERADRESSGVIKSRIQIRAGGA